MSLGKCLQDLCQEGTSVTPSLLMELSNLTPAEVERLSRVWAGVSTQRRQKIIEHLVELAEDSAEVDFSAFLVLCLKDPNETVREKSISGLWEYEDRTLVPALCELLQKDPSSRVRSAAAMALGKFAALAQESKILPKDSERVQWCLLKSLQDTNEDLTVRRRALEAVAPFNNAKVNEFIRWAYDSGDLKLKCSALYAMGKTGEPRWLGLLLKELKSDSPKLRYESATACGELAEESAIPYLIPLLEDDDLQVQLSSIRAIGGIGGPLAKKALRRCLKSGDPAIEEEARAWLEQINAMEDPSVFKYEP